MKLIHDGGFGPEEREAYKEIIFSNAVQSIHVLIEAMENLGIQLNDTDNQVYFDFIMNQHQHIDPFTMPTEVVKAIKYLWQDAGVQEAHKRRNEFQLNDSAS
jgi:guanine nucleotide-binding protein subunit alpha